MNRSDPLEGLMDVLLPSVGDTFKVCRPCWSCGGGGGEATNT